MAEFAPNSPKLRARQLILSHIAQFSLMRSYGRQIYGGSSDFAFHGLCMDSSDVLPGDLVAIQSARPSKWYLGWLVSKQRPEGWSDDQFTIESIEDGELCNWSNIGLIYYDRSQISGHPEWRWSDKQHAFNDRWNRVCYGERDAYIYLPIQATFLDDDGVELSTRTRYGLDDTRPTRRFENWRKVTKAMMLAFYDDAVAEARAAAQANRAAREKETAP